MGHGSVNYLDWGWAQTLYELILGQKDYVWDAQFKIKLMVTDFSKKEQLWLGFACIYKGKST